MSRLYSEDGYLREGPDKGRSPPWRPPFVRDYGRVIHSAAFRRLQGKTQVFPGHESDFFRNRLTHSLEVAQIAEGIADRLNHVDPFFQENNINGRLCALASLMHDLGHPPFGHNGEKALDDAMRKHGGFEGNAQTLRIVSRTEKKIQDESGNPYGMNLTFRSLASILKYDRLIPRARLPGKKLVKGYYHTEFELVKKLKAAVVSPSKKKIEPGFKTIECSIMDIADDIAYSTYDLEDSLKAGFLTPAAMLSSDDGILGQVADKVSDELDVPFSKLNVLEILVDLFDNIGLSKDMALEAGGMSDPLSAFVQSYRASHSLSSDGRLRTQLSSQLVSEGINAVEVDVNEEFPALSRVRLNKEARKKIEVLKQYTYITMIFSSRVSIPEFRGYEVVKGIFEALSSPRGHLLMPDDVRNAHAQCDGDLDAQMRVICDFVAGMTDRYAMEFFGRLHSDSAQSMFKPV